METAVRDLVVAARNWAEARERCRAIADSKRSDPQKIEKAKRQLSRSSDTLFKAVRRFETILHKKPKSRNKPLDWNVVFGAVGELAKAFDATSVSPPDAIYIDTTAEKV
jgi:hypothetical protein